MVEINTNVCMLFLFLSRPFQKWTHTFQSGANKMFEIELQPTDNCVRMTSEKCEWYVSERERERERERGEKREVG